jgi:iron complex transport system ATP-binding protein
VALLRSLAQHHGKAVVMVLHEPARARRFCNRALLLFEDGRSLPGPVDELLGRDVLERLYGCPVEGA